MRTPTDKQKEEVIQYYTECVYGTDPDGYVDPWELSNESIVTLFDSFGFQRWKLRKAKEALRQSFMKAFEPILKMRWWDWVTFVITYGIAGMGLYLLVTNA